MTREEFEQYAKGNGLVVWSKEMSEKAIKALEQEPRKGHWIYKEYDEETGIKGVHFCSECGYPLTSPYISFCSVCGADMRETPKRKALKPIEGNNDSYNCENWIP